MGEEGPQNPAYMFQYWGLLSNFLTKLKLVFMEDIHVETLSALNQLTRLQGCKLDGFGGNATAVHLQLPELGKLTLEAFGRTAVSLHCPKLKSLKLLTVGPLGGLSGLPDGIEKLHLNGLQDGSVPVEQVLPAQGLKHLSHLGLLGCSGEPMVIRDAYVASRLVDLSFGHQWAPLMAFQPLWQGMPLDLKYMYLEIPLDEGIPLVLEQLSNLERLALRHVGTGPMHLIRSLDPFLDMERLFCLQLLGPMVMEEELKCWTPAALRYSGLANRRILRKRKLPGGNDFSSGFRMTY